MSALTEPSAGGGVIASAEERLTRAVPLILRLSVGFLWLQNAGWKVPPDFGREAGRGLFAFTAAAVEYPVFSPFSWIVEQVVLPNFVIFGWAVLILEASLGAFLLVGLATRFWALVGVGQSVAIGLSVAYAPHEWPWSYVLMVLANLAIFAMAAGRTFGLDGVLRPIWQRSRSRLAEALELAS